MISFSRLGHYGQFGNQLWQYALIKSVAKRRGSGVSFPQNRHLPKRSGQYELWPLGVSGVDSAAKAGPTYTERSLRFDENALLQPDGTDFLGYFQSWKYIEDEESLRQEFSITDHAIKSSIDIALATLKTRRTIVVNVRRGDYLGGDYHLVLPARYYQAGMELLDDGETDFLCVSDDLRWCRDNFPRAKLLVPSSHWQAFGVMCQCDGMIGSASSFSWWAAFMQGDTPKVFPDRWYGPSGPDYSIDDILPPGWQRITA